MKNAEIRRFLEGIFRLVICIGEPQDLNFFENKKREKMYKFKFRKYFRNILY
jgi:hypothetical protein